MSASAHPALAPAFAALAAEMRATAQHSAAERRVRKTLQALVLTALARLIEKLAEMIALWQSGQFPPPTSRRRPTQTETAQTETTQTPTAHAPRASRRPIPHAPTPAEATHPRSGQHSRPAAPKRAHRTAHPAAKPATHHAPVPRAQPPPPQKSTRNTPHLRTA